MYMTCIQLELNNIHQMEPHNILNDGNHTTCRLTLEAYITFILIFQCLYIYVLYKKFTSCAWDRMTGGARLGGLSCTQYVLEAGADQLY